jgi:succinate-semialdehyde dehydrogenase/glutarate-semialdehyde dehydrogenase
MAPKLQDPKLFITKGYIGGEWTASKTSGTFDVINPSNEEVIATLPEMGVEDVALASQAAAAAVPSWKATVPKVRGQIVRKWADLMIANASDLGTLMTLENGKPFAEAKGEIVFAAGYLQFYAGEAERCYGDVIPSSNPVNRSFALKEPIGVVACLTPWNFPAAMITRKAGAAIAAGCTVVSKPAGETPLTALAIAYLGEQAGLPKGVLNVITTMKNLAAVGKAICEDQIIRKLSFTGSTAIGKLLMQQCSGTLKKLSMELGGNSPFIVFDDCDLNTALDAVVGAKIRNSGQTCVSANRIYVQKGIYSEFIAGLKARFEKLKQGDGFDEVTVGPLTIKRGVEKGQRLVDDAVSKGAKVVYQGKVSEKGYYFPLSIIADMQPSMTSHDEEFFAPIAGIYPFNTEEEVIAAANKSSVGLGSYICTENYAKVWRVSEALEVGMVGVNTGVIAAGELPFQGVKGSGFGSEGGKWGLEEYLVTKTIVMAIPARK